MTVKKLLLFAFVLTLSLAKAQTQINDFDPKLLVGFDEEKYIKAAKKEGVKADKIQGFLNSMKAKYIAENHPGALPAHKEKTVVINVDRQGNQHMQSSFCQNLDFSSMNYSNWTGDIADNQEVTGTSYPAVAVWSGTGFNGNGGIPILSNTDPTSANAFSDRHVVMNKPVVSPLTNNPALAFSNGYDPVCQNTGTGLFDLPMVPMNGMTSLRLGSEYANQTVQKIIYSILVSPQNIQFTYQFAVVLNDGTSSGHGPGDQPAFAFQLKDFSGTPIGGPCGKYEQDAGHANSDTTFVLSSAPAATSFNGAPVYYRRWHTQTVDLSAFMGQTVYAEFQTLDCTATIHFGYAYLTATCGALNATVSGFCGGQGTAVMNAPPGFNTYQWYGPNSNTTIITGADSAVHVAHNANPNDSFFVYMTTLSGCTTKLKVTVVASNISATPQSSSTCKGGSNGSAGIVISGGGTNFSYTWQPGGHPNTSTINNLPAGTYTVYVVDNTGTCPPKDTVITVLAVPPPLTTATVQLCGTQLSPQLTAPAGSLAPFSWTMNGGGPVIGTSQVLTYTNAVSGSDYFTVTYIDPTTHCEDSLKTTLTPITINFSPISSPPCNGGNNGSIILNPGSGNTYPTYDWTLNGLPGGNNVTPPLIQQNLPGGTYNVVIHPSGNPSCTYTLSVPLVQGTIPPPILDTTKACALDVINLAPAVAPGSTHSWYTTPGGFIGNAYPLIVSGSMNYNGAVYTDTIRNSAGCKSIYQVKIKTKSFKATLTAPQKIKCHDDSTGQLKATATTEINGPLNTPYSFTWAYPPPHASPATINMGAGVPQSAQAGVLHPGTYTVVIKSGNCYDTLTYTLTNPALLPTDSIYAFFCPKDSLAMIVAEHGMPKYTWLHNGVVVTPSQNPNYGNDTIYVATSAVHDYWVTYTEKGCKDTAKLLFTYPSYHAFRPDTLVNIFTPNGDSKNDLFYPFYGKGFTQVEVDKQMESFAITIYNRWGTKVFETDEYSKGWNGNDPSGKAQDDGTYYFILRYKSNCSTKADIVEKHGFVQLLR